MNISLTDELRAYVEQRVAGGRYASTSEYLRSLIRLDQDREALRSLLIDGARSPVVNQADTAYFESLRVLADADR